MMLPLMGYSIAIGIVVGAAAWLCEWVAAASRRSHRWTWAGGLIAIACFGAGAVWRPAFLDTGAAPGWMHAWGNWLDGTAVVTQVVVLASARGIARSPAVAKWDALVPIIWVAASGILCALYFMAHLSLQRRRRGWRPAIVCGTSVFVDSQDGPAVAGIFRTVIVIPEWALEFDSAALALMLAHEREHQRARDPLLLHLAAVVLLMMPWNIACWWMYRRLKLAIEVDCDARVLAGGACVTRPAEYGELLLTIASRGRSPGSLLMPAMLGHSSTLPRRISAMFPTPIRLLGIRTTVSIAASAALLAVALLLPAPRLSAAAGVSRAAPRLATAAQESEEPAIPSRASGVSWPVAVKEVAPQYTEAAKREKVEGEVQLSAVVGVDGKVTKVRVTKSLDTKFGLDQAAVDAASKWTFKPSEKNGKPVPVRIEMMLDFKLK
jgi:TonB family protein